VSTAASSSPISKACRNRSTRKSTARAEAENLIKAHKLHLASDRTSCTKATANQFRLLIHTAAYWLMLTLRDQAPRKSFWRDAQFDTIRLCLIKVAGRVTEMVTRIKIALPSGCTVGLIGPDGVGKSTVLSLIAGARQIQSGTVHVLGRDMANARARAALYPRIAYMPQGLGRNCQRPFLSAGSTHYQHYLVEQKLWSPAVSCD